MKRLIVTISMLLLLLNLGALSAYAEQEAAPALKSISFSNAVIDGEFSPDVYEYTVTLENTEITPTLKSYELDGSGDIFVTYELDEAKHQTGILVTVEYSNGSVEYKFGYSNVAYDTTSANNLLAEIKCNYCELYPEINDRDTSYRLYIPSDLTELNISTVTQDVNAYCDLPKSIELAADQEPEFSLTVTAANGDTRAYKLKIKRIKKTTAEIIEAMSQKDFKTIVEGELFYQKPLFKITAASIAGGLIAVAVLFPLLKRIAVKAEDDEEPEFFDTDD